MYQTKCPSCDVEDKMSVVGGVFHAVSMPLHDDGFDFSEAKNVHTEDETICCEGCGRFFSLSDLWHDEPPPPPDKRLKVRE